MDTHIPQKTFSITRRIDAVTGIPQRYLAARLPAPRAVKIELTSQCNYRCGFCAHRLRMKKRGEMDMPFFQRVVGEMVERSEERRVGKEGRSRRARGQEQTEEEQRR